MNVWGISIVVLYLLIRVESGSLPRLFSDPLEKRSQVSPTPPVTNGCEYNGKMYPPGSEFGEGYDAEDNWCYGIFCSEQNQLIYWDNFNCKTTQSTTTPRTSPTPSSTTTTTPASTTVKQCEHNGNLYPPNTYIESGYDEASDWCYGTFCDTDANLLAWDTWNCKKSSSTVATTPVSMPTPSSTAQPASMADTSVSSMWKKLKKLKLKMKLFSWLKRHS